LRLRNEPKWIDIQLSYAAVPLYTSGGIFQSTLCAPPTGESLFAEILDKE